MALLANSGLYSSRRIAKACAERVDFMKGVRLFLLVNREGRNVTFGSERRAVPAWKLPFEPKINRGEIRTNRTKQGCAPDRSGKRRPRLFSASDQRAKSPLFDLANDSRWHFDLKILPAKPVAVCNTPPGKKIASFVQPRPLEVVIQGHTDLTR